jgi:hypothetical protein
MEQDEARSPATAEGPVDHSTEASLRAQITDLLLKRPRDVRTVRSAREQSGVLKQIEAALETYRSYFYPPEHRS